MMMACSHRPPAELVQAREAYERAASSSAQQYSPADLHVAKDALLRAEQAFRDNEDDWLVRAQAYIAMRKAELAQALARKQMYEQQVAEAEHREEKLEKQIIEQTKEQLDTAKQKLDERHAADSRTERQLYAEREARADAERRAALAAAELARVAAVTQDERGTVVTLSGAVLFPSGKSTLLPQARLTLDDVANALLEGDPDANFVIEGHTDSQGSNARNQQLSIERANAVRDYLVSREIAADRITTVGHGEERPIADNRTAEGRANNRRVEIVIKPSKTTVGRY